MRLKAICGIFFVFFEAFASGEVVYDALQNHPALGKVYLGADYGPSFPQSYGQVFFAPGTASFGIRYRYVLNENWLLGVKAHFKHFRSKEEDLIDFPIFSFSSETVRLLRVHHPLYFGFGGSFGMLIPVKQENIPLDRSDSYESQIAVSLHASLLCTLKNKDFIQIGFERWRGTKTQRLQGLDIFFNYSFLVD